MEKKKKIWYVITIILYGLAAIGGILTIVCFLIKNPILQGIGIGTLVLCFLLAIIIEKFILKKE